MSNCSCLVDANLDPTHLNKFLELCNIHDICETICLQSHWFYQQLLLLSTKTRTISTITTISVSEINQINLTEILNCSNYWYNLDTKVISNVEEIVHLIKTVEFHNITPTILDKVFYQQLIQFFYHQQKSLEILRLFVKNYNENDFECIGKYMYIMIKEISQKGFPLPYRPTTHKEFERHLNYYWNNGMIYSMNMVLLYCDSISIVEASFSAVNCILCLAATNQDCSIGSSTDRTIYIMNLIIEKGTNHYVQHNLDILTEIPLRHFNKLGMYSIPKFPPVGTMQKNNHNMKYIIQLMQHDFFDVILLRSTVDSKSVQFVSDFYNDVIMTKKENDELRIVIQKHLITILHHYESGKIQYLHTTLITALIESICFVSYYQLSECRKHVQNLMSIFTKRARTFNQFQEFFKNLFKKCYKKNIDINTLWPITGLATFHQWKPTLPPVCFYFLLLSGCPDTTMLMCSFHSSFENNNELLLHNGKMISPPDVQLFDYMTGNKGNEIIENDE